MAEPRRGWGISSNPCLRWISFVFVFSLVLQCECILHSNSQAFLRTRLHSAHPLPNVMPFEEVMYSPPVLDNGYNSTTQFHPRGMAHLYKLTKMFIRLVQREEALPKEITSIDTASTEWHSLLLHYGGTLGVAILGLLLAVSLPLAMLLFCCCRCAGRCGARTQPFDKRHDPCRRHFYGVVLGGITIVILFGVVCAFVTNEFMEQGLHDLPDNTRVSINDTLLFLENTKREVNNLLVVNYEELSKTLYQILRDSGKTITEELAEVSHAVVLTNLTAIIGMLGHAKEELVKIERLTRQLQGNATIVSEGLDEVREKLLNLYESCQTRDCKIQLGRYEPEINQLRVTAKFDQAIAKYFPKLPNVTDHLRNVTMLLSQEAKLLQGKHELERIQSDIQQTVDDAVPMVNSSINSAGTALRIIAKNLTDLLTNAQREIYSNSEQPLERMETYLHAYSPYRYYVGLAMSSVLLVVLTCLTLALFCGFCGKRPDASFGDDCCNRGSGSRFLILAVWSILMLGAGLTLLIVVHFVVGVMAERAVCEPLREPQDNQLFALIDRSFPIRNRYMGKLPQANTSTLITWCHQNQSLYTVLGIEEIANISELNSFPDKYHFKDALEKIKQGRRQHNSESIRILTPDARLELMKLAESSVDRIDFHSYPALLSRNLTTVNLQDLQMKLEGITAPEIRSKLLLPITHLPFYNQKINLMAEMTAQLNYSAQRLSEHLSMNHTSLRHAIELLLRDANEAEKYLSTQGPNAVYNLLDKFVNEFLAHVERYMNRVITRTKNDVGRCGPLSRVYNATLRATCDEIVNPFNGFWASVGGCIILFIPTMILAVKLSTLYQKTDPYPGALGEAEYLYDAYADRDSIPLANVQNKKNKNPKGRSRNYQENLDTSASPGYMNDYSAHLGRGERDRVRAEGEIAGQRYADMAPKVWDYPNNGPPRYNATLVGAHSSPHTPPISTEYERPPPYYYPGPGENRP